MVRICAIGVFLSLFEAAFAQVPASMPLDECLRKLKAPETRLAAIIALADHGPKAAPAIPDLLDSLRGLDDEQRVYAANTLSKIGKEAVAPVAKLVDDTAFKTRYHAIATLGSIGPDAAEAVPALVRAMTDENVDVRRMATNALGRVAGESRKAHLALILALSDQDPGVRTTAFEALERLGKTAAPALGAALGGPDPTRVDAGLILRKIGKAAIPILQEGLKSDKEAVRNDSIRALGHVGPEAVPILIDLLGDKSAETRRLATKALASLRITDKTVVLALAKALRDPDRQVKDSAIEGLQLIGPFSKLAAPFAEELLVDPDTRIRYQGYYLLRIFDVDPRPGLIKALETKNVRIRVLVASFMLTSGHDRDHSVPVLRECLKSNDDEVRIPAAAALAQLQIEGDPLVPVLIEGLKNKSRDLRYASLQGLVKFGAEKAPGAVGAMIDSLEGGDGMFRMEVCQALHFNKIAFDPKIALPNLVKCLKSDESGLRRAVVPLLARSGNEGVEALAAQYRTSADRADRRVIVQQLGVNGKTKLAETLIFEGLADKSPKLRANTIEIGATVLRGESAWALVVRGFADEDASVRRAALHRLDLARTNPGFAARALEAIGPMIRSEKDVGIRRDLVLDLTMFAAHPKEAVPLLMDAFKDTDAMVRWNAVHTLGSFGSAGVPALAAVEALHDDPDHRVREEADSLAQYLSRIKAANK